MEKEGHYYGIQVKATSCKTKYRMYQVALKSCGGTKGKTYKTVIDTKVDYVFIVTEKLDMYMIPRKVINNRSTLNLCSKYVEYKIVRSEYGSIV